jgi:hypothetical protein
MTVANTWQQLNPTADPFASLPKNYYHTVTNAFATNIIVGDQTFPGMESIFALQHPHWLHDVIITWWLGYWCEKTGGLSNFSITNQRQRPPSKIDGQRKSFFATPFFWNYVLDGEIRGANETKYVDIFTCSRMLIPVNIKLKHWILACIDFEQKWIALLDSIGDTYEQETRLLFAWFTKEHSVNRPSVFEQAEWSIHSGPPPNMQVPLQSNDFDCCIFICFYAAYLDLRLPLSFSQHDTRNIRAWMTHEMIEEGKLASEKQKNIRAAAEFWADMRQTHGFQNQATGLKVQADAVTEVARAREPGSSSKQQVEAHLESQENPKRRRRSDDEYKNPTNHSLDTITAKPIKINTEPTGEYTKPITTAIPLSDTPTSGSGDATLLTTNEAHTHQALDTIPVKPVKRTKEDTDKFVEPITTTTPQGDNPGTASLTVIEEETHNPQTQTGSTDEVWPSHRNPKSDKVPNSPTPGTSSKQHVETLIENLGNHKRTRGSDDEHPRLTTLLMDTITPRPVKRNKGFTGEYVKPTTTRTHQDVFAKFFSFLGPIMS